MEDNLVKIDEKWTPEPIPSLNINWKDKRPQPVRGFRAHMCLMSDYKRCDGEFEIIDEYVGINTDKDLANMDISRELELLFGKEETENGK